MLGCSAASKVAATAPETGILCSRKWPRSWTFTTSASTGTTWSAFSSSCSAASATTGWLPIGPALQLVSAVKAQGSPQGGLQVAGQRRQG